MLEERIRSSLYEQLASRYGAEEATAVIEAVAEVHGGRLATKDDIAALRVEMLQLHAELKDEIRAVSTSVSTAGRNIIMWTIPTMATLTAMAFVAARIA